MCMHDNPLRIKVEVEDTSASPSPALEIIGTDMKMKDLMSDVASMKAFAEAITTESAAAVASAVAEEPAVAAAAATMMGMAGGGGDDSGKPRAVKNRTLVSAMDIVEASGAFMDRNIVGSHGEVVGVGESQRGRSCNKHHVCGSQLRKGSYVCFRKTWFVWRGGDEEDVLEVFHLDSRIMGWKVGYLPKHLAA